MLRRTRKNKSPKTKAFNRAWKAFRDFIIKRDKGVCFTCGEKGSHAGHFVHGKTKPCYFDPINVHAQCIKCNFFLDGNRDVYLRKIQLKYGIKKGDYLLAQKFKTKSWTLKELQEIEEKYKNHL